MDTLETVLAVIGGAVLAATVVIAAVYLCGPWRDRRYRPGRHLEFSATWLGATPRRRLAGTSEDAVDGDSRRDAGSPESAPSADDRLGGASERW